jgi:hypothetical protein
MPRCARALTLLTEAASGYGSEYVYHLSEI